MKRTAESVTPFHPDKLCDQISDRILDAYLTIDPDARVAVETMGKSKSIYVSGEITSKADVNIEEIVRNLYPQFKDFEIIVNITKQSPFISQGVDIGGAGDQGIMKGYAVNETPEMIPLEVLLSRKLAQYIYEYKQTDGKTQVTININENIENGTNPQFKIETIVASFQGIPAAKLQELVREFLSKENLTNANTDANPDADSNTKANLTNGQIKILTNPAGDWEIGGFEADAGQTGRKLVIDNYGPQIAIGGGCFSGKDPTKVDRSAAYMARKIAVDYLQSKHARQVFVDLAYSIGVKEPVQATVEIILPEVKGIGIGTKIQEKIKGYDLSPQGIIDFLDLRKPQYFDTAKWGHFGRGYKWDK